MEQQTKGPDRRRSWARVVVVGFSAGLGVCIGLALAIWSIYWYHNRSTPVKEWPALQIQSAGIELSLKTMWSEGSLKYKFRVSPLDPKLADAFDKIAKSDLPSSQFTLRFYDRAGFKVCDVVIERLTPNVDDKGRATALTSNEETLDCSRAHYREAQRWTASYRFPVLWPASGVTQPTGAHEAVGGNKRKENTAETEEDDSLTGFDLLSGRLETHSGHTFVVAREGERNSAIWWKTSAKLHFVCKGKSDCLVENRDNDQAVHARMLR